jgi:tyrosyl-tRNA synthetase
LLVVIGSRRGGAKVNDVKIDDEFHSIAQSDFNAEGELKLSSGKKKHVIIEIDNAAQ